MTSWLSEDWDRGYRAGREQALKEAVSWLIDNKIGEQHWFKPDIIRFDLTDYGVIDVSKKDIGNANIRNESD